jgi:hypothetical protein
MDHVTCMTTVSTKVESASIGLVWFGCIAQAYKHVPVALILWVFTLESISIFETVAATATDEGNAN